MASEGKYPRTYHFPFTGHHTTDDKKWTYEQIQEQFSGKEVVVSAKIDGENSTLRRDIVHARSLDGRSHISRTRIKALHAKIKHDIPENWRICGENMFAEHSLHYYELTDYFYVFTIFNEKGIGLPWDETTEYATMLGLKVVPVLWRGVWDEEAVKACKDYPPVFGGRDIETGLPALEGYVARLTNEISVGKVDDKDENSREILLGVGKYVRFGHVKSDIRLKTGQHWLNKPIVPNNLAEGIEL